MYVATQKEKKSPKNSKLHNHNVYTKDLVQTNIESMCIPSVSVSPYMYRLFDSMTGILLVSLTLLLIKYILSLQQNSPSLAYCLFVGGSLHLLLSVAG